MFAVDYAVDYAVALILNLFIHVPQAVRFLCAFPSKWLYYRMLLFVCLSVHPIQADRSRAPKNVSSSVPIRGGVFMQPFPDPFILHIL